MVVNPSKTEVVIFGKNELETIVRFAGIPVRSSQTMKALGITIQSNLKWNTQVSNVINKAQAKLSLLRKIRKYLTVEQFLVIATSQIYSGAYYASQVWLNCTLSAKLWKKMNSLHYRIMRVACNDFKARKKKEVIDSLCKRATPKMWSDYASSSLAMKILRDETPKLLYECLLNNTRTERRRQRHRRFFDLSRVLIGRHSFANRLLCMNDIEQPWCNPFPNNDAIRILLKDHLNFDFISRSDK